MKKDIHPDNYRLVVFKDVSNDHTFLTRSTIPSQETVKWEDGNEYPLIKVEISDTSHPFYTGKMKFVDTAGRIEKFQRKYKDAGKKEGAAKAAKDEEVKAEKAKTNKKEEVKSKKKEEPQTEKKEEKKSEKKQETKSKKSESPKKESAKEKKKSEEKEKGKK